MAEYKLQSLESRHAPKEIYYGRLFTSASISEKDEIKDNLKSLNINAEIREYTSGYFEIALDKENYKKLPMDAVGLDHYISIEDWGYSLYPIDKEEVLFPISKDWHNLQDLTSF